MIDCSLEQEKYDTEESDDELEKYFTSDKQSGKQSG